MFYECFGGSRPGTYIFRPRGSKPLSLGLSLGYSWLLLGFSWALLRSSLAPFGLVLASSWLLCGSPGTLWDSFFSNVFVGLALGLILSASLASSWPRLGFLLVSFGLPSDAPGLVFYERFCGSRPGTCIVGLGAEKPFSLAILGSSWPPLGSSWASLKRSRT